MLPRRYRGVREDTSTRYSATITAHGKSYYLGSWPTARLAAIAWDRFTLHLGIDRPLHLPKTSRKLGPASRQELLSLAHQKSSLARGESSRYFGVCFQRTIGRWEASVSIRGRRMTIGHFRREIDAAIAHDRYVLGALGPTARVNFPKKRLSPATLDEIHAWARRLSNLDTPGKASRFEGVFRQQPGAITRPWVARLIIGKRKELGSWESEEDAARAYDRAALHYLGPQAFLNFPGQVGRLVPADAATLRSESLRARKKRMTSRFLGVSWSRKDRKWKVQVRALRRGECVLSYIAVFDDEKSAARARDRVAIRAYGKNARLNFHPKTGEEVFGRRLRELTARRRAGQ